MTSRSCLQFLKSLLQNPIFSEGDNKGDSSDKLIDKVLYLIGSCIVEEKEQITRNPDDKSFEFCRRAEEEQIMGTLRKHVAPGIEHKSFSNHQEMVSWVLNITEQVASMRLGVMPTVSTSKVMQNEAQKQQDDVSLFVSVIN